MGQAEVVVRFRAGGGWRRANLASGGSDGEAGLGLLRGEWTVGPMQYCVAGNSPF